ncbi:MAG: hypothetical protein LAP86_07485 [Acidobacteriia bacterium]|nr:hypothetical protein [Terriglobia bacterium]
MSKKLVVALTTMLVCSVSFAQELSAPGKRLNPPMTAAENAAAITAQKNSIAALPPATSSCNWTFTSPQTAANKFLEFCVTVNGNIVEFQSPSGVEHIRVGAVSEGYGICDGTTGAVPYFDYADSGDSANWQAPVTLASTATSVKIKRTTTDSVWTLIQTISINKPAASAYITMALKNNTAATRLATLVRFADVDAGGVTNNNLDGTLDSAWGYDPIGSSPPYAGLLLQVNGPNTFNHQAWAINTSTGPNPCTPNANFVGTLTNVDGGIVSWNLLPSIAKGATKTVKLKYTAF